MHPDVRAVLFDLDDTLYPVRRFVVSGFAAVARHVERHWQIEARDAFAVLTRACRAVRGRELQALVAHFALPSGLVPQLIDVIRGHEPTLRLPRVSARVLRQLGAGWRIGVVTNGVPAVQARKVGALGLASLVDTVVYAHATGAGLGKPDAAPFLEAIRRLGVPAPRAVFIGDDPVADIGGAGAVGMRTIQVMAERSRSRVSAPAADAVVRSIGEVPSVAGGLLDACWRTYVV